jgi:hypothetical protein
LGADPLRVTQPLSSLIGVGGVVTGMAVARRVAGEFDWPRRRVSAAVVATGAILALDGIYLRRTMVADEEVMAYVFIPLLVLSLHLWLDDGRRTKRWGLLAGLLLFVMPLQHILSTLVAALSVIGLVVVHLVRNPSRRTIVGGGLITAGFWVYFGAYYQFAARFMELAYVDRVTAFPGLFLAWGIILVVGVAWSWTTSARARALAVVVPLGVFYAVAVVNVFISVYPGTPQTPIIVLVPVLSLGLPLLVGALGMGLLSPQRAGSAVVIALLAGPLTILGFSLTASLTPEYVGTAIRGQTFGHLPLAILAGLVIAGLLSRGVGTGMSIDRSLAPSRSMLQVFVVGLVLVATVGSLPFAYINLDTGSYPSTTFDSELRGVEFAAERTAGPWATDHSLSRSGIGYFRSETGVSATASWVSGGASPTCPVLSQESWTTTGAHLFPFAPDTVSEERYEEWLGSRHIVYVNTGHDPVSISLPVNAAGQGC